MAEKMERSERTGKGTWKGEVISTREERTSMAIFWYVATSMKT